MVRKKRCTRLNKAHVCEQKVQIYIVCKAKPLCSYIQCKRSSYVLTTIMTADLVKGAE